MKSLLLAATALTAFTISSFAADLPARKQAPVFTGEQLLYRRRRGRRVGP